MIIDDIYMAELDVRVGSFDKLSVISVSRTVPSEFRKLI